MNELNTCYEYARDYALSIGVIYPSLDEIAAASYRRLCEISTREKARPQWQKVPLFDGAMVLIGFSPARLHHCGIYNNGMIHHNLNGVVRVQKIEQLKSIYKIIEAYKWAG